MSEAVEGEIENLAKQDGNHGIKIDGDWYNPSDYTDNSEELKQKQRELSEGQRVKLKDVEKGYFSEIIVISGDNGGSESASISAPNGSEGGQSSSDQSFEERKDRRIAKKVAFKEAAETVRQLESDNDEGEHQERVSAVANGYYNILKSMGDE